MQNDVNRLIHRKKMIRRFVFLLLLSAGMAVFATYMRDCSQTFEEPYNKDYRPMDQQDKSNKRATPET